MVIETNLQHIEAMAAKKADENWKFRTFLKQLDMATKEIDAIVHQITDEVTAQIDCTKCANCCQQIKPVLDKNDIAVFSLGLETSISEFEKEFLEPANDTPSKHTFNKLPCPFLKDNLCSNYECRPKDCRSYPHLHKEGFVSRLWGVVENYSICPIVFNVYERLKTDLWHHNGFDEDDFGVQWSFTNDRE